jgi:hypothetical protein
VSRSFFFEDNRAASCELLISVANRAWLAALDQEKNRLPQTYRAADQDGWCVVLYSLAAIVYYILYSILRSKYAG